MEFTLKQVGETQVAVEGQSWNLTVDVAPEYGGKDLGPKPTELLAIALAACETLTGLVYARLKEIPVEGLSVRVTAEHAKDPQRLGKIVIEVDGVGEQFGDKKDRIVAAMSKCPVANTLRQLPEIELHVS